ncbi:Ger(x)C family spore germination C-terminal domain-containing protein [Paenibacillus germinis]|uniref:Ger(x)C family spore germination C-terminal domain-containing protein n=1 Tax=Paenibacillus germinis TaxID=2654979 RepID=UPI00149163BA|nr:Ger(x)C family spore germination C-terminal domain-containing protein [Paenibacillus germinis]
MKPKWTGILSVSPLTTSKANSAQSLPEMSSTSWSFPLRRRAALTNPRISSIFSDSKNVDLIEKEVEKRIGQVSLNTVSVLQKKYKKAVIGLGEYLNNNHYRLWQSMQDDWNDGDHLFSSVDIEMHAQVAIRRIGDINRSE